MVGPQSDVQDRLYSMSDAPQEYDAPTTAKLQKLAEKRTKLEAKFAELDDDNDPDNAKSDALNTKLEALDDEEQAMLRESRRKQAEREAAEKAAQNSTIGN